MHAPDGKLALDRVRLDLAHARGVVTVLQVLDLDHEALLGAVAEHLDERLLGRGVARLGRAGEIEAPERLFQLLAHALQRRVRIGRDRRPDVLDREANRARFEWSELRRPAEHVAVQLLLDPDDVAVVLGVHGVAAAAEIDEVEEREVILELLERDGEPSRDLVRRDRGRALVAARREQVRQQRLQNAESLGRDRAGRSLGERLPRVGALRSCDRGRVAVMRCGQGRECLGD